MDKLCVSSKFYKSKSNANPCLSNVFCADPTAIEFEGRLYVYATNDQQQFETVGYDGKNTYEFIKTLSCFSTEDMINWTFHGIIQVDKICPWSVSAWSPAICCRKEKDNQTHFYLYFSDNGCGVGVLTATSPLGPWTDPLGKALVSTSTPGLRNCPFPFAPGVCLDDNGDGYLVFGGTDENNYSVYPGTSKIVKLSKDLISFDSDFIDVPAPYFLESSDLNFVNGKFVYTYNNNWQERTEWNYESPVPSACSMAYMITETPLVKDSWQYKNHYFKNPGEMGLNYSNNHTHFIKFKNNWYIFYHTLTLQEDMPTAGGFRSICVDKLMLDEENVDIKLTPGTRYGVPQVSTVNALQKVSGATMATSAEVEITASGENGTCWCKAKTEGSWILVKNVSFNQTDSMQLKIDAELNGGYIEIRLDKINSTPVEKVTAGIHDVYFVFSKKDIVFKSWKQI